LTDGRDAICKKHKQIIYYYFFFSSFETTQAKFTLLQSTTASPLGSGRDPQIS
jgi:hypothetical protein